MLKSAKEFYQAEMVELRDEALAENAKYYEEQLVQERERVAQEKESEAQLLLTEIELKNAEILAQMQDEIDNLASQKQTIFEQSQAELTKLNEAIADSERKHHLDLVKLNQAFEGQLEETKRNNQVDISKLENKVDEYKSELEVALQNAQQHLVRENGEKEDIRRSLLNSILYLIVFISLSLKTILK